jgi:hypothetical protein
MHIPFKRFFTDKRGQVVLWQRPNAPILIAIALTILHHFFSGTLATVIGLGASGAWLLWSIWEIKSGVNGFRRMLGVLVFAVTVNSLIQRFF